MATHIPAWKRLGLTLKYAKDDGPAVPPLTLQKSVPNEHDKSHEVEDANHELSKSRKRRKINESGAQSQGTPEKDNKKHDVSSLSVLHADAVQTADRTISAKSKKRVSFSVDSKTSQNIPPSEDKSEESNGLARTKKKKHIPKSTNASFRKSNDALDYLKQHQTDRSTWKFNKNRETWILKHALSTTDIPSQYNLSLARYTYGLKSEGARSRLMQQCHKELSDGTESTYDYSKSDAGSEQHLLKYLEQDSKNAEEVDEELQTWAQHQPRAKILLLSMRALSSTVRGQSSNSANSLANEHQVQGSLVNGTSPKTSKRKQAKTRTAVIDFSSSSESDEDSEDEKKVNGYAKANHPHIKESPESTSPEATSSSGGSSTDD